MITQKQVAEALGISQSTVSLALKGNPKIPKERREEIQKLANDLGYRPSSAASELVKMRFQADKSQHFGALAWLNFWSNPDALRDLLEFEHYFQGASEAADKFGYHLYEFQCNNDLKPKRLENILLSRGIHGLLIPPHPKTSIYKDFDWGKFSFVKFGKSVRNPVGHIVTADQHTNTILAFNEMKQRGYKRIGFATDSNPYWQFDTGFIKAQLQIPPTERIPILGVKRPGLKDFGEQWYEWSVNDSNDEADFQETLHKWIENYKPDAILTTVGEVPEMVAKIGYNIPQDIGIATTSIYDGHADAGIDQNSMEVGRVAVLQLISMIQDNDVGVPALFRETHVKGKWIDGKTLPRKELA